MFPWTTLYRVGLCTACSRKWVEGKRVVALHLLLPLGLLVLQSNKKERSARSQSGVLRGHLGSLSVALMRHDHNPTTPPPNTTF